ncbi:hypothetical protein bpln_1g10910 [Burkholderia plantarii]|nr:hypothetical protein bpln_1g10910 [Burkholderia plantarii]
MAGPSARSVGHDGDRPTMPVVRTVACASFCSAAGLALGACAMAPGAAPVAAPGAAIEAPEGVRVMTLNASGVQIYACEFDAQHRLQWVFKQPRAVLYDDSGREVLRHGAGPSWQAGDGSRIVGQVRAQQPSATPGSIPQLLLLTHGTDAAGLLAGVRYVQRIHTVGGTAPAAPCASEHQSGSVPYLAQYVFYR